MNYGLGNNTIVFRKMDRRKRKHSDDTSRRFMPSSHSVSLSDVLAVLCPRKSRSLRRLVKYLHETGHNTDEFELESLLSKYPTKVKLTKDGESTICEYCFDIKVCTKSYDRRSDTCVLGWSCKSVHICTFFLSGQCSKGNQCDFPHDLSSPQNTAFLRHHSLDKVDPKYILSQINQTDLDICTYYNSEGGCKRHDDCNFLHICRSYIDETCPPFVSCKYNHDVFTTNCPRILESHGISMDRSTRSILRKLKDKLQMSSNAANNTSLSWKDFRPSTYPSPWKVWSGSGMSTSPIEGYIPSPSNYTDEEGSSGLALCTFYNSKRGCNRSSDCKFLHMCRSYISKKCPSSCKYNHNLFTPDCKRVLKSHGIFMEQPATAILRELKDKLESSSATSVKLQPSRQESTVASRPMTKAEICTYNIRGKCNYGESCMREHYGLPYRWFYKLKDVEDAVWKPFTDEEQTQLEEKYCDVSEDSIEIVNGERFAGNDSKNPIAVLHFENMEISDCEVVRKSTASSVNEPPNHPFTTEWMWYWEDNDRTAGGKLWRPYGQKNSDGNAKADKESHELEESYQQFIDDSKLSTAKFNTGANSYTLDFKTMTQTSETYTTIREVRRRPKEVVTTLDISNYKKEIKLNRAKGVSMQASGKDGSSTTFPDTWEKTDGSKLDPDATFQLFDVKSDSAEYSDIERLFSATCPNKILKIQRVQNEELWEDYARKRERMKKKTKNVDEKRLWHGTREYHVKAICQQNFDFRCSGTSSGTAYGQGSYFAKDASYSSGYAIATTFGRRFMFLAKVLVGEYTVGNPSHRRPPEKTVASGQIKTLYDSCVNQVLNPSIFVIFDKDQMYPEYLIEY